MNRLIVAAIAAFLLTGCMGTVSPSLTCGFVKDWTPREQRQMADDLKRLPDKSPIHKAMQDYARMRSEAVACQSQKMVF